MRYIRYAYALTLDYFRDLNRKHPKLFGIMWPYYVVFLATFIIELPQITSGHIIIGADTIFHFNRFYEGAMQIAHHNWSYWISIYGFHDSARIVNAVYSPYLAYILGLVLLICHSFFRFQILMDFVVPLASAVCLQIGFHIAGLYSKYNRVLLMIYPLTYQVFHWNVSNNFTSIGSIFIPLVVGCLVKMLRNHTNGIIPIQLGMITGLIVQVHLVTALQSLILEAIIIPIAFFTTHNYRNDDGTLVNMKLYFLRDLSCAVLIGSVLSANLLAGLWELFSGNHITTLQQLNFAQDRIFSYTDGANGLFMNTVIFIIMITLILTTISVDSWQTKLIGSLSLFCFFLSTNILPWRHLMRIFPPLSIFQYPSRFLVPAVCLACFFTAMTFSSNLILTWYLKTIFTVLAGFVLIAVVSNYHTTQHYSNIVIFTSKGVKFNDPNRYGFEADRRKTVRYFRSDSLDKPMKFVYQGTGDYLPLNKSYRKNPYGKVYWNNLNDIYAYQGNGAKIKPMHKHSHLTLKVESDNARTIHLPVVAYQNTQVLLNGQGVDTTPNPESEIPVNLVKVPLIQGTNYITVKYQPNIANTILVSINLAGWIIFILVLLFAYVQWKIYEYRQNHE